MTWTTRKANITLVVHDRPHYIPLSCMIDGRQWSHFTRGIVSRLVSTSSKRFLILVIPGLYILNEWWTLIFKIILADLWLWMCLTDAHWALNQSHETERPSPKSTRCTEVSWGALDQIAECRKPLAWSNLRTGLWIWHTAHLMIDIIGCNLSICGLRTWMFWALINDVFEVSSSKSG